jgi:hypothetical protein
MSRNCFCFLVRRNGEDVVPIAKWQYAITVMPIVLLRIIYTQKPDYPRVVHQLMLVERRIHLIENLCLDEPVKIKFRN